jgi:2-keto-4-pentenoate hydratase/2-oxohepta-3-ene-1,7-dioic acid hydratase in catechol pathway
LEEAARLVLGYSILLAFSDGRGLYGPGFALGPFVVTPEDVPVVSGLRGRLHLGEEVVATVDVSPPVSLLAGIVAASRGADVREGDVFAVGPIPGLSLSSLRDGDGVIAVVEKLGALGATVRV